MTDAAHEPPSPGDLPGSVLHVLTRVVLGGPTRPVLAVVRRLARAGSAAWLAAGPPGLDEEAAAAPAIDLVHVPSLVRDPSPVDDVRALAALTGLIRRLRPTIVHSHTAKAGALARFAARVARTGAKTVHTFHGHSLDPAVSGAAAGLFRLLERGLARASDRIVTLSPGQRADLARRLGAAAAAKMAVVPLAIDRDEYPDADPAQGERFDALTAGFARRFVFVGRGVPVKALDRLAAAFARAVRVPDTPRTCCVVIGPVESGVRSAASSAAGEAPFFFFGPAQNPLPLIRAADALVLPSWSEGTPVAVIEALGEGKPVLASSVGGIPELLAASWTRRAAGDWRTSPCAARGALLAPGDLEGWTAALAAAARDPSTVPGEAGERRSFALSTFDADARAGELFALYGSLRARRASRQEPAP